MKSVKTANARKIGNGLLIEVTLGTDGGDVSIAAILANDPAQGVKVIRHQEKIPLAVRLFGGEAVGKINEYATNIDSVLKNLLNARIDQNWEISSFNINPDALGVNFRRKD